MYSLLLAVLATLGTLPGGPPPEGGQAPAEAPARLALVVGIDSYAPGTRTFRPLLGCVRDARRVQEVLVDRFGFEPEDVLTLVNEEATVEAVVRAFDRHLIRRAGPDTEVVFWFSGHGSRVPDKSGRELAGLDSSLVAFDSRAAGRDGSYDLSDDLIAALRQRLTSVTERVTIVTDACHSGGVTRGANERVRSASAGSEPVEPSLFESFWPADVPLLEDDDPRRDEAGGYVHIAACSPQQQAREIDLENGESQGALTFFLTRGLVEAQPGTSYAALARDVAARLATRFPGQTLCYEGAVDRTLFGARFAPRPPGHAARALAGGKLSISAGQMLGLRPGSELSILEELADRELGTATVVRSNAYSALAEWDGDPPSEAPEGALRAVERSRPAGQDPLPVHVTPNELAERVATSPLIEPSSVEHPDAYSIGLVDGSVAFLAPDGVPVWVEPEEHAGEPWDTPRIRRAARALLAEVRDELTYRSLLALSLGGGPLKVEAGFVPPNADELREWNNYPDAGVAELREDSWSAPGSVYRVSTPADSGLGVLEVRNTTDHDVFVAIVSVMEDRSRYLVWPHQGRQEHLAAGRTLRAPVGIQGSPSWDQERPMRDRYLIFATTRFADFSALDRDAPRVRGGGEAPLPDLIGNALLGPVTRGSPRVSAEHVDWGVVTVDLLVEPAAATPTAR